MKGFTTELHKTGTTRTYGESTSKDTTETTTDDQTDGAGQSKLKAPDDDEEEGEEKITVTITPIHPPISTNPGQVSKLSQFENMLQRNLASPNPVSVQIETDDGYVSLNGALALWLSRFLAGNEKPVEGLNRERGLLYIPEFFRDTLVTYVNSLPESGGQGGTLIWIEIPFSTEDVQPAASADPSVENVTIHYFINIDGQVQMTLYMEHINSVTGQTAIATVILQDEIDETDPLENQRSHRVIRTDSMTNAQVVLGGDDFEKMNLQDSTDGTGVDSIPESSGDPNQDATVIMMAVKLMNDTLAEVSAKKLYQGILANEINEWNFKLETKGKTFEQTE